MKFLTWNIHSGGGKRIPLILRELESLNSDFIGLTEVTIKNYSGLRQSLNSLNYKYVEAVCPPTNDKSVLVASKTPFRVLDEGNNHDRERWLSVEFVDTKLKALCVHIPGATDSKFKADGYGISGEKRKELFWSEVIKYAKKYKDDRTVLLGDFNTGLKEDAEGTPFKLSEFIKELKNVGFIDTWRHLNPTKRDYTWYWRRKNKLDGSSENHNGFRLDYVFVSPQMREGIVSTQHIHHVREQKLSDHSLVFSELNI